MTRRLFRPVPSFKLRRRRRRGRQSVYASREGAAAVSRLYMFHTGESPRGRVINHKTDPHRSRFERLEGGRVRGAASASLRAPSPRLDATWLEIDDETTPGLV